MARLFPPSLALALHPRSNSNKGTEQEGEYKRRGSELAGWLRWLDFSKIALQLVDSQMQVEFPAKMSQKALQFIVRPFGWFVRSSSYFGTAVMKKRTRRLLENDASSTPPSNLRGYVNSLPPPWPALHNL